MREHAEYYAEAFFNIIRSEGNVNEIQDELFRFAQALENEDELRAALTNAEVPVARRQQIVEDLLKGRANPVTVALVSMVVGAGRARDLAAIVDLLLQKTAELTQRSIAEVRSAVELTDEQKKRLAESLRKVVGHDVEVYVIIDPTVLGGIVTQIGDTVIDGSVRHRLDQMKAQL
jgi:F-type H+-transporting ATPase subunit delta